MSQNLISLVAFLALVALVISAVALNESMKTKDLNDELKQRVDTLQLTPGPRGPRGVRGTTGSPGETVEVTTTLAPSTGNSETLVTTYDNWTAFWNAGVQPSDGGG